MWYSDRSTSCVPLWCMQVALLHALPLASWYLMVFDNCKLLCVMPSHLQVGTQLFLTLASCSITCLTTCKFVLDFLNTCKLVFDRFQYLQVALFHALPLASWYSMVFENFKLLCIMPCHLQVGTWLSLAIASCSLSCLATCKLVLDFLWHLQVGTWWFLIHASCSITCLTTCKLVLDDFW